MKVTLELQLHEFEKSRNDFTFIPYGLESKLSKEAVKVHVLHGRKRHQHRPRTNQHGALQSQTFAWDSKPRSDARSQKLGKTNRDCSIGDGWTGEQYPVAFVAQQPHASQSLNHAMQCFSLDHRVLRNPFTEHIRNGFGFLSNSRLDAANFLVNHCTALYLQFLFRWTQLTSSADLSRCGGSRFPRELLACYWHDAATFKAFLAHAATLFSLETGLLPPVNVEVLMCSALQEIRTRLDDPLQRQADGTVLAVAILANVEEGRTQQENAACHWRGLRRLLQLRGTLTSLRRHRDLHTMLLWREILTSNSYDLCFGHGIHDFPHLQYCNEHIIAFFDNFANRLSEGWHLANSNADIHYLVSEILNSDMIQRCEWTSSMKRRSEIACLTYLSMLAVSAKSSAHSRNQLATIKNEVTEREEWGPVGQDELLFVMLSHGNFEQEWLCQRIWQLSRCVYMTRTLDLQDWKTVRDLLSLFLGVTDGCDGQDTVIDAWENLSKKLLLKDGCNTRDRHRHITYLEGMPR